MGQILSYKCACGYSETLKTGCGYLSKNAEALRNSFGEEIFGDFYGKLLSDVIAKWYMYQAAVLCRSCGRLFGVTALHAENADGEMIPFPVICPECAEECAELPDKGKVRCPKCGSRLAVRQDGRWD